MATIDVKDRHVGIQYPLGNVSQVPPLESGDCLTREEFERRYEAMPHLKKAELIEGRVYMSSAVRKDHSKAHGEIIGWLLNYRVATPGVELYDNATVRLDEPNEPQPDALLRIESETGDRNWEAEGEYIEHPPELIVEIAGSSASYDLHEKLNVYQRNGVQEYVVWQIYENRLDWFQLVEGKYVPLPADADNIIRGQVFPGLHLPVEPLLAGDISEVLAVLQKGLQTQEHTAFVQYLRGESH
jgi:Uma2 family endonuclease